MSETTTDVATFSEFWPTSLEDFDTTVSHANEFYELHTKLGGGVLCDTMLWTVARLLADEARDVTHLRQLFEEARERLDGFVDDNYLASDMAFENSEA
jgi:hypothetical protein